MKPREANPRRAARNRRRAVTLALLAALAPAGCGREFFREWANQDVSEVVFEKSRDPRFRIDTFSIAPPWMSRYAHPYDPDFPPSPPDDFASQALSPIPQWSKNQLMVPAEGTGYLAMLESYQLENEQRLEEQRRAAEAGPVAPGGELEGLIGNGRPVETTPPPPTPGPSPFSPLPATPVPGSGPASAPPPNSGTPPRGLSPNTVPGRTPTPPTPPAATPAGRPPSGPQVRSRPEDDGVRLVAMQDPIPGQNPNAPNPNASPPGGLRPGDTGLRPGADQLGTPRVPGVEGPQDPQNLGAPVRLRPDLTDRQLKALDNELIGLLGTGKIDFKEAEAIGLPTNAKPYRINLAQALSLALVNARIYQFNLEQLYLAALPVTLQRFAFTPQFIAGLSPITPTVGPGSSASVAGTGLSPVNNPANSFSYRTRATGLGQQSTLNIGTVAAVGKSFDNGAKILAGFASQIVFNFTGVNPRQPAVQSFLPIQAFVPLLRGGGRAVTLEALTQAERNLLYQVRAFAKFRQEFFISTLTGNAFVTFGSNLQISGFTGPGNVDPVTGYLNVVEDIGVLENNQRNVETFLQFSKVYRELIKGEASGLTQLQLDQLDTQLQNAKLNYYQTRNTFRADLDSLKVQLGLPPDTYIAVDRGLTLPFKKVFEAVEAWSRDPRRQLSQLEEIARGLPDLEDIIIDGRSCHKIFNKANDPNVSNPDEELEDLLLAAERVAMENRLDLMNVRAQLYDAWRQIRVAANALQGVLNVTVTNQILTPPTTTNPFAFLSQAKQFSLVLNAELPLVRISERNNFMTQLINYERQRRTLMNQEDFIKVQVRGDVRGFQVAYLTYLLFKRNFVLFARQKDQAFENIVAPPQSGQGAAGGGGGGGGGGTAANASGAIQTQNLISAQIGLVGIENSLITQWYNYQQARLTIYRDLGNLPYDEWEAFYELFPSEYRGIGAGGRGNAGTGDSAGAPDPGGATEGPAVRGTTSPSYRP
jgi:hypothetical protein